MGNQGTENRPETDGRYLRPAAAYELMKTAQGMRRTVYIYGASGSGKTSFIADFSPEGGMNIILWRRHG